MFLHCICWHFWDIPSWRIDETSKQSKCLPQIIHAAFTNLPLCSERLSHSGPCVPLWLREHSHIVSVLWYCWVFFFYCDMVKLQSSQLTDLYCRCSTPLDGGHIFCAAEIQDWQRFGGNWLMGSSSYIYKWNELNELLVTTLIVAFPESSVSCRASS